MGPQDTPGEATLPPPPASASNGLSAEPSIELSIEGRVGDAVRVSVFDPSGLVEAATQAGESDLKGLEARPLDDAGAFQGAGPTRVIVAWIGSACDETLALLFDAPRIVVAPGPRKGCDAVPLARGIELRLSTPVDARTLDVQYVRPDIIRQ